MEVQLGERGTIQFDGEEGALGIVDFMFMAVTPFLEIPKEPSSNQKELILALLSDRSLAVSTISGRGLIRFPID